MDAQFFGRMIETLLVVVGGGLLTLMIKLIREQEKIRSDLHTHINVQNIEFNNIKGQYNRLEKFLEGFQGQNPFEIVQGLQQEIEALRATLRHHDKRFKDMEDIIVQVANKVGVKVKRPNTHTAQAGNGGGK